MKIIGETIAHAAQRYDTLGDYTAEYQVVLGGEEVWHIRVSKCEDWRAEAALFLHEFIEAMLTKERGITPDQVDDWDRKQRDPRADPGDEVGCPYRREHRFAENLERLFVAELGLTWQEYEQELQRAQTRR